MKNTVCQISPPLELDQSNISLLLRARKWTDIYAAAVLLHIKGFWLNFKNRFKENTNVLVSPLKTRIENANVGKKLL